MDHRHVILELGWHQDRGDCAEPNSEHEAIYLMPGGPWTFAQAVTLGQSALLLVYSFSSPVHNLDLTSSRKPSLNPQGQVRCPLGPPLASSPSPGITSRLEF